MTSFTCPLSVHCGGVQRQGSLAPAPLDCSTSEAFSPRTVLTESICKWVQHTLQHFPTTLAFLANRHNNLFLPGYSSSPGWLLVTRTRGAWWCRYRGCCRSGPRHRSPRSRVCAQEWHCKDIHSHIHSHTPIHTPQKKKKKKKRERKKEKNKTLNSPNMMPSFTGPLPVQWAGGRRPESLAPAPLDCTTSEAFSPRTVLTVNICRCIQQIH